MSQRPNPDFVFPAADSIATTSILNTSADVGNLVADMRKQEGINMVDALNRADSGSGQALTYGMYLSRNKTIADIASDMAAQNLRVDNGMATTLARQGEINEWQAQNKFDTLFFLQTMFLYFCAIIILLYLRQLLLLPQSTTYWIITFLTIALIGVFVNRAYYTAYSRDNRYWNRRRITLSDFGGTSGPKCDPNAKTTDFSSIAADAYDRIKEAAGDYQTGLEGKLTKDS